MAGYMNIKIRSWGEKRARERASERARETTTPHKHTARWAKFTLTSTINFLYKSFIHGSITVKTVVLNTARGLASTGRRRRRKKKSVLQLNAA